MDNVILKKENGQVTIIKPTEEELKQIKTSCHMCAKDCANARANKCTKVEDIDKQTINAYDYITDGYQVFDENSQLDTFIVSNCENYKREVRPKNTKEQINRLKELKASLRTYFFDTETVDDAYLIQDFLMRSKSDNNRLMNVGGRTPNYSELRLIKQRRR